MFESAWHNSVFNSLLTDSASKKDLICHGVEG
jgi:hypothetical protein